MFSNSSKNFILKLVSYDPDIEARLDARTKLKALPKRMVKTGLKIADGERLNNADKLEPAHSSLLHIPLKSSISNKISDCVIVSERQKKKRRRDATYPINEAPHGKGEAINLSHWWNWQNPS